MLELVLIGIGTGNPEHLTLEAIGAMRTCDLILLPRKGEERGELAQLRRDICAAHLGEQTRIAEFDMPVRDPAIADYRTRVDAWHDAIAGVWATTIDAAGEAGPVSRAGLLVWGDPSLYDSTLRIAERLQAVRPLSVRVVPGVTSLAALTAAHAIPLNEVGEPFLVTTGRKLRDDGFPPGGDTVAVMLDGECSFTAIDPRGVHIWWAAYAGMPQQAIIEGSLAEVSGSIQAERERLRARHGWIMDIYLLRRTPRR